MAPEYRASDSVPADTVTGKWNKDILQNSVSLWPAARKFFAWNYDQPVLEAELFLQRRNLLAPPAYKELKLRTRCFLCPEPLRISAVSL